MKNIALSFLFVVLTLVGLAISDIDFNNEDYFIEDSAPMIHSSNLTVNEKTLGDSFDGLTTINQDLNFMPVEFDFDSLMKCNLIRSI